MKTSEPPTATPAATPERGNLAAEIALSVERKPGDTVKCTWVGGDNYRCNWWAPSSPGRLDNPNVPGPTYGSHVVRMSRFLTVTKTAEGLLIDDKLMRIQ